MAAAIPPKVSKWFDVLVSVAAAVVIYGALQKILHTEIADIMLKVGLTTEAVIFLGYGILYIVFPAIDDHEVHLDKKLVGAAPAGNPALKSMEKMLDEADITPASLSKLSAGFQKLGTTVDGIGEIGNAVAATGDYTQKTKEATKALTAVKDAYASAADSVGAFNDATTGAKVFHSQIQILTNNLSSLNTIYELELQESNNHLKALNSFYSKLNEASAAMTGTAEDANKAKQQIVNLANNLGKLNQIYGGMITAMQGR
jgi:gliding motility-associated protein GldL